MEERVRLSLGRRGHMVSFQQTCNLKPWSIACGKLRPVCDCGRTRLAPTRNEFSPNNCYPNSLLPTLTERERQIVSLVSDGLSNGEVGQLIDLTPGTIRVRL
jgi:Bacterial regulatory proteins, luxR family